MEIALDEPYPLLETLLKRSLEKKEYRDRVVLFSPPLFPETADLCLYDHDHFSPRFLRRAKLIVVPSEAKGAVSSRHVLTAGMGLFDPLTFSSLKEDRAMLCLQKGVAIGKCRLEPREVWVPYDPFYSVYKNLAVGMALLICDEIFGRKRNE